MLSSAELLDVARLLVAAHNPLPPSDGQLRRAVSTAYYALFHRVLDTAATRFFGSGNRHQAGFALLYRGFHHGRMKTVCKSVDVPRLSPPYARQLGTTQVSREMRSFANSFVALQEVRQFADYDPHWAILHADAIGVVGQAELGIQAFGQTAPTEQADVLALMLVNPRD